MSRSFAGSSVGTKVLIAVTGLLLFVFLIGHLAGNLLVFVGPEAFNTYSDKLISNPLVIPLEIGLLLIVLVHIYKTVKMYLQNQHARPGRYAVKRPAGHTSRKSLGSTTMIISGLVTALFVIVHLQQFKFGAYYETTGATPVRDLYRTEVEFFQNPFWVVVYVVCMGLIFLHLRHGIASAFQSLGTTETFGRQVLRAGMVAALVIGGGFAIIPLFIYFAK